MSTGRLKIRQQIESILQRCGIKEPPVDVEKIAKGLGIRVQRTSAPDDLSGFLLRDPSGEVVIGVNSTHSPFRQRFTIAHELGHFHLHRGNPLYVDRRGAGFEVHARDARSSQGSDRNEIEANAFAGELLMPTMFMDRDLMKQHAIDVSEESNVKTLAERYEVSTVAMSIRLSSLGYIRLLRA